MDEFIFNITAASPNVQQQNAFPSQTTKSNPKGYKTTMNNTHLSSGSPKNHPSIHDIKIKNPGIFKTMDPQNKDHATSKSGQAPRQMPDQDRSVVSQQTDSTHSSAINEPIYVSNSRCRYNNAGMTFESLQILQLTMSCDGVTFPVWLKVKHSRNGNLVIFLYFQNDDIIDIWTVVTANLPFLCDKNFSYIDTRINGEKIRDWLVQNKLATPTRRSDQFGYYTYPIYEFDPEVLKRLDPEGYNEYIEYWERLYAWADE